jgi:D-alanyl-D-alanine carboxypeptidase
MQTDQVQAPDSGHAETISFARRVIVGGVFLAVSLLSAAALMLAVIPPFNTSGETQAAAVEVAFAAAFVESEYSAKSVYVFDVPTDVEIFEKNSAVQLPLASITKVALALVVAEALPMDSAVAITVTEARTGGLRAGETWRVRDLVDYMLMTSSNGAAEVLASAAHERLTVEKGISVTARMNDLAKEIGLSTMYFLNPTGLDESATQPGALGSARDVALLFSYAMRTNRDLFSGTSRASAELGPIGGYKRTVYNTNEALDSIPNIFMGKTGFTDLAGGNLAIAYDADENHPVIIVLLGSTLEGRFADMRALVEATSGYIVNESETGL